MLICLPVVASVITLVITIIIMKKLAKQEKNSADIYQNRGLYPESTAGDSPPLYKYVEILSDTCTLVYQTVRWYSLYGDGQEKKYSPIFKVNFAATIAILFCFLI